jgi:hypothetical protein
LNLVAASAVMFAAPTDGIGHLASNNGHVSLKFTHEVNLVGRLREHQQHGVEMAVGHAKDVVGFFNQFGGGGLATQIGDVDVEFLHHFDGVGAGGLSIDGADASGLDMDVLATFGHVAEKTFGHGATTDVASADKENAFHGRDFRRID